MAAGGVLLKIQFSSESNNKFSFRRPKDERGEHFNSPKRPDFVLRGMFIRSRKEFDRDFGIKCLFGTGRNQENINFKENLIDPSNINGLINNWWACCAGRVSHATKTANGSRGARKNTGLSAPETTGFLLVYYTGTGRRAQFAFRCRAILCIFKFVIAELSPGTGKFSAIKSEKVELRTRARDTLSLSLVIGWFFERGRLHNGYLFLISYIAFFFAQLKLSRLVWIDLSKCRCKISVIF